MGRDLEGETTLAAALRHFAINADDPARAKAFYERVFGWRFEAWGPPNFFRCETAGEGIVAAIQGRRELIPGVRMTGFECTIGVEDLQATIAAVEGGGGAVIAGPFNIPGVGELAFFRDPEGNLAGVMQYAADT
jgi:predicted enzyme related to lactoylglutathione lyase